MPLYNYQQESVDKFATHNLIIDWPTGSGKTKVIYEVYKKYKVHVLYLVPTKSLLRDKIHEAQTHNIIPSAICGDFAFHSSDFTIATPGSIFLNFNLGGDKNTVVVCDEAHLLTYESHYAYALTLLSYFSLTRFVLISGTITEPSILTKFLQRLSDVPVFRHAFARRRFQIDINVLTSKRSKGKYKFSELNVGCLPTTGQITLNTFNSVMDSPNPFLSLRGRYDLLPILIYCPSIHECKMILNQLHCVLFPDSSVAEERNKFCNSHNCQKYKDGRAIHNSSIEDRPLVELMLKRKLLDIIIATDTLTVDVDFEITTIVIPKVELLYSLNTLQIIGRCGRSRPGNIVFFDAKYDDLRRLLVAKNVNRQTDIADYIREVSNILKCEPDVIYQRSLNAVYGMSYSNKIEHSFIEMGMPYHDGVKIHIPKPISLQLHRRFQLPEFTNTEIVFSAYDTEAIKNPEAFIALQDETLYYTVVIPESIPRYSSDVTQEHVIAIVYKDLETTEEIDIRSLTCHMYSSRAIIGYVVFVIVDNDIEVYETNKINIENMFTTGTHPAEEKAKNKIFDKYRCKCNAPFRHLGDYLALQIIRGYQFSV
jgi:hypothetical protein